MEVRRGSSNRDRLHSSLSGSSNFLFFGKWKSGDLRIFNASSLNSEEIRLSKEVTAVVCVAWIKRKLKIIRHEIFHDWPWKNHIVKDKILENLAIYRTWQAQFSPKLSQKDIKRQLESDKSLVIRTPKNSHKGWVLRVFLVFPTFTTPWKMNWRVFEKNDVSSE